MSDKPSLKPLYQLLRDRMEENGISLAMRNHFEIRIPDELMVEHGYVRLTSALNSFMDRETKISRFAWSIKNLASSVDKAEGLGHQLLTFVIDTRVLQPKVDIAQGWPTRKVQISLRDDQGNQWHLDEFVANELLESFPENLRPFYKGVIAAITKLPEDLPPTVAAPAPQNPAVEKGDIKQFIRKYGDMLGDNLENVAVLMMKLAQGRPVPDAVRIKISDEDLLMFGYTAVEAAVNEIMDGCTIKAGSWNLIDPTDYRVGKMMLGIPLLEWCINTAVFKSDYTKT